jgi:Tfp pilus assembly protein PilX
MKEVIGMQKVKSELTVKAQALLRSQSGFSVLVVIFVMMVLSAIGYSMARMMASKQMSVPVTAQSSSAFYAAEGGINWAAKDLNESELVSWESLVGQEIEKNLGGGKFVITYSEYCAYGSCPEGGTNMCVTATSTGTYGDGVRVVNGRFCREQGYGCSP